MNKTSLTLFVLAAACLAFSFLPGEAETEVKRDTKAMDTRPKDRSFWFRIRSNIRSSDLGSKSGYSSGSHCRSWPESTNCSFSVVRSAKLNPL